MAAERDIPNLAACSSFHAGHTPHWIQAKRSREAGEWSSRKLAEVRDDGTIAFVDGPMMWNHEPDRLRHVLDCYCNGVEVSGRSLMLVGYEGGAYCFSLAKDRSPCIPA